LALGILSPDIINAGGLFQIQIISLRLLETGALEFGGYTYSKAGF
jgi:hypothetical protein